MRTGVQVVAYVRACECVSVVVGSAGKYTEFVFRGQHFKIHFKINEKVLYFAFCKADYHSMVVVGWASRKNIHPSSVKTIPLTSGKDVYPTSEKTSIGLQKKTSIRRRKKT